MRFFSCLALATYLVAAPLVWAQDITDLGGDLSSQDFSFNALQLPAPNISSRERFEEHLSTHRTFHKSFNNPSKGGSFKLGPRFNHVSCGGCHVNVGRGQVKFARRFDEGSSLLLKVSLKGRGKDGKPRDVPGIGEQLQDHHVDGRRLYNIRLRWRYSQGYFDDGTPYELRRPVVSFDIPGINPKNIVSSLRQTPPVIGSGLLEAVPSELLVAMSDPDDLDGDGISGEINYVPNLETGQLDVGRFGFRATHPSVKQQSAAAFFFDMGITNDLFREAGRNKELPTATLNKSEFYLQAATIPAARNQSDPDVIAGKLLFQQIGCDDCHKMTLTTGNHPVPELVDQTFHPFTDLLLHDMGPGLADRRPEYKASGREWRTSPLWGLGIIDALLTRGRPGFLHDGRARTITEAILWHGGEAAASQQQFKALSASERDQLLAFLNSI